MVEGWKEKWIDEVFVIKGNNTFSRDMLNYKEGSIKNIHYGDILTEFGNILNVEKEQLPYIKNLTKNSEKNLIQDGDVIIADTAEDNTVGKACEVIGIGKQKVLSGLHTIFLHPDENTFEKGYLGYYFNSQYYQKQLNPLIQGIKVSSISKKAIKSTTVLIPPRKEQKVISGILSDIDNLILSLEQLIEKKKAIKQGTIQELLTGKKRLDGFTGAWIDTTVGAVCDVFDGTHQTPRYVEKGIPFYSVENVTNNEFKSIKYISPEEHEVLTKSSRIEKGDILMTRIGSIGVCKYIDWDVNASYYVSLALIKCKKVNAKFLTAYSYTKGFQNEIELNSLPSATPKKINLGPISDIKIRIPRTEEEQKILSDIVFDLDTEILTLESKLSKYRQIKQGMMQELLTGRIRLI